MMIMLRSQEREMEIIRDLKELEKCTAELEKLREVMRSRLTS